MEFACEHTVASEPLGGFLGKFVEDWQGGGGVAFIGGDYVAVPDALASGFCGFGDFFPTELEPEAVALDAAPCVVEVVSGGAAEAADIVDAEGVQAQLHGVSHAVDIPEFEIVEDFREEVVFDDE